MNKAAAIIAAAGASRRMKGEDKMLAMLGDKPVIARVLDVFEHCPAIDRIVIVLSQRNISECTRLIYGQEWPKTIEACPGGERRQDSVLAGLIHLEGYEWVVIHDGARPLVTVDLINRGLEAARETGAAVAALPVTDTIKMTSGEMLVKQTLPRQNLWAAQTPQVFRYDLIREAYQKNAMEDVTDDASLVEKAGHPVKLYTGSYDNIKITTNDDLVLAETLLKKRGSK